MKYDFTTIMDRRGKDALAIDMIGTDDPIAPGGPKEGFDIIPMWVADMNFPVAPSIQKALQERIAHPAFGYFRPTQEYFDTIIRWHKERNGVEGLLPEHIGYENSVLGGVLTAVAVACSKGDKILVHSPTYVGFTNTLTNAGYTLVHSEMYLDDQNIWRMDFAEMEQKIAENNIHTAIFCAPHNPTGRVWERWELEKAMEVFRKYDVTVISDEIWSDIILTGHQHIPLQSISEDAKNRTIAVYAPSKTFNLSGLIGSYHIIYNPTLRHKQKKEASLGHYNCMNVLSMHALMGAYQPEGQVWTDELCQVITGNVEYACQFIAENFPGIRVSRPQGTYMLFLDCEQWCKTHGKTVDELLRAGWDVGVIWQDGRPFHRPWHIRMNLALPLSRVQEAFSRLEKYVMHP